MEWLKALILGAVQGVTEFLPISSDGHLAITQHFFDQIQGVKSVGAENLFFDVMLHLGTLAAILIHYRAVGLTAAKGVLGSTEVAPTYRRNAVIRTILLSGVATTPLIPLALFLKKYIDSAFGSTAAAGVGFLITAGVLLITMRLQSRGEEGKGPLETTWLDALLIGIAQMFAPLPGVSRSGLTIAAGLSLGLSRAWAVGFSLLIAIPAILGGDGSSQGGYRHVDSRPDRANRRRLDFGGYRRLWRDHLAGEDCQVGSDVVFLCIPSRPGDRGSDLDGAFGRP